MTIFILYALGICILALGLILWPLVKTRDSSSYERQAQNIHFAQQRLAELEQQLKDASISENDYAALKLEIENTLADDIDINMPKANKAEQPGPRSNKALIACLVVLLPLGGLLSYAQLGTPETFSADRQQAPINNQDIDSLISSVESRLANNPEDLQGWRILSRTYLATGQYAKAKNGFLKVLQLEGESPEILVSIADATALQAGGDLSGEASDYIQRALEIDPNYPQALWLAGLNAAQQNKPQQARANWNRLMPLLADNPQQQQELRDIIAETMSGGIDTNIASEKAQETNRPAQSATTAAKDSATAMQGVSVRVSLASDIASLASPEDLVYVFARAENGPPAPLAVQQIKVANLPVTLNLSDANAMMPQFKLSLFENIVVSARVAKAGNPVAQKGDLQSQTIASKNNNPEMIVLEISSVVE